MSEQSESGSLFRKRAKVGDVLAGNVALGDVTVAGWVRSTRVSKNFGFVVINDGSCQATLQLVVDEGAEGFDSLSNVSTGCSVRAEGKLIESPGKGQKYEIQVSDIKLLGSAPVESYPLQKKGHSMEFMRTIAHLRPRTNTFGAVFRVRNVLAQAVHEFFNQRGYAWAHTPLLTASDGEGAGEMFQVSTFDFDHEFPKDDKGQIDYKKDFFGKKAYLAVTGQLEAEFMALALGDVYTFGPTFRAENSQTSRHLAEFWMIEPEMSFADMDDAIELAGDFIRHLIRSVLEKCPEEMKFFEKMIKNVKVSELQAVVESSTKKVTYTEAVEILQKSGQKFEFPVEWGIDLATEHERYLTDEIFKCPVAVTNYPKEVKAFYMRQDEGGKTVAAFDFLVPKIGELIGGSQREERLDYLERRMEEMNIPAEDLDWYADLRRFGTVVHSGFGMGFERMVMYVTGMSNIRDVIPCPRVPGVIEF